MKDNKIRRLMCDYISESEALANIYDCGTDDFIDENGDYCLTTRETPWFAITSSIRKKNKKTFHAGRTARLSDDIENVREANKAASTGSTCICPMCKKSFRKTSYQMTFCSSKCRLKYNNSRFWY